MAEPKSPESQRTSIPSRLDDFPDVKAVFDQGMDQLKTDAAFLPSKLLEQALEAAQDDAAKKKAGEAFSSKLPEIAKLHFAATLKKSGKHDFEGFDWSAAQLDQKDPFTKTLSALADLAKPDGNVPADLQAKYVEELVAAMAAKVAKYDWYPGSMGNEEITAAKNEIVNDLGTLKTWFDKHPEAAAIKEARDEEVKQKQTVEALRKPLSDLSNALKTEIDKLDPKLLLLVKEEWENANNEIGAVKDDQTQKAVRAKIEACKARVTKIAAIMATEILPGNENKRLEIAENFAKNNDSAKVDTDLTPIKKPSTAPAATPETQKPPEPTEEPSALTGLYNSLKDFLGSSTAESITKAIAGFILGLGAKWAWLENMFSDDDLERWGATEGQKLRGSTQKRIKYELVKSDLKLSEGFALALGTTKVSEILNPPSKLKEQIGKLPEAQRKSFTALQDRIKKNGKHTAAMQDTLGNFMISGNWQNINPNTPDLPSQSPAQQPPAATNPPPAPTEQNNTASGAAAVAGGAAAGAAAAGVAPTAPTEGQSTPPAAAETPQQQLAKKVEALKNQYNGRAIDLAAGAHTIQVPVLEGTAVSEMPVTVSSEKIEVNGHSYKAKKGIFEISFQTLTFQGQNVDIKGKAAGQEATRSVSTPTLIDALSKLKSGTASVPMGELTFEKIS